MELLTPAAVAAGTDLDSFLTAVALGTEMDGLDPRADRISLLTLHASKGLEFGLVIIVGCEDGLLPLRWGRSAPAGAAAASGPGSAAAGPAAAAAAEAEAEERRLLFVGITRARTRLVLTHATRRRRGGEVVQTGPSPFLSAIDGRYLEKRIGSAPSAAQTRRRSEGRQLRLI